MNIKGIWNKREYSLITHIGSGRYGKVYKAKDDSGNIRAIKISEDLLSITNEYNAMIKLDGCSFIPKIYDFDDLKINNKTYHFIVMDYIPGKNLKEIVKKGINTERVFKIGLILANILAKINGLNYKYTDIKLENIIIDEYGRVYFVDFGSLVEAKMPTKEYTPTYNINSWNVGYKYDLTISTLFSVTMIMVVLIGRKEYNPLVHDLNYIRNEILSFSLNTNEKQFLIDGLMGKYSDFTEYFIFLSQLINTDKKVILSKIDYLLIASIVSFVFVIIFGIMSFLG